MARVLSPRKPTVSSPSLPRPKYIRSRSFIKAKMLRLTDTRGSPAWPAAVHASRKLRVYSACRSWNGRPLPSALWGVLRHVHRALVAHVDRRGADLDPFGPGADGGQQRKR